MDVKLFLGTNKTRNLLRRLQKDSVFYIVILLSPSLSCQTYPGDWCHLLHPLSRIISRARFEGADHRDVVSRTRTVMSTHTQSKQKTVFFGVWKSNYLSINLYLSSSLPVWTCHLNTRVCWQAQYSSPSFMSAPVRAPCHVFLVLQSHSIVLEFVSAVFLLEYFSACFSNSHRRFPVPGGHVDGSKKIAMSEMIKSRYFGILMVY